MTHLTAPEHQPALLRSPPWASGTRAVELPHPPLPPFAQAPRLCWSDEERASARLAFQIHCWTPAPLAPHGQDEVLGAPGIHPDARARLHAGAPLQAMDFMDPQPRTLLSLVTLLQLPDALALSLWNGVPPQRWDTPADAALTSLLARHGQAAAPGLVAYATRRPVQGLRVGRCMDCPELAALALKSRRGLKVARQPATDWLLRHPRTSAHVLLRQLFGTDEPAREDARAALHVLAAQGLENALAHAAQELGDAVQAGLSAELNADPLLRLPARMPRLPAFFVPARLHRPRLASDGAALPDEAMQHLGLMLAISRPDQAYAGLDAVAAQRGLSRIELADRLVPALGLDESRTLDFGPRQFHIGLDETLAPHVKDAQGARLKDLPKPHQSDAAAKADAAVLRYRRLKSELKALVMVQVARLELAMVMQRRWALEDFRTLFVRHTLTRELATRLRHLHRLAPFDA